MKIFLYKTDISMKVIDIYENIKGTLHFISEIELPTVYYSLDSEVLKHLCNIGTVRTSFVEGQRMIDEIISINRI